MRVQDLESIRIKLASPEDILRWSHGEVVKAETINYRTQRPEKDGLFCEKIFGPAKDYECYCGKYKRIRYKGVVCDRCGVEVIKSSVRRERMGHIKLAVPCSHIWFLRGLPSRMGMVLNIPMQHLEKVIYFAGYIITGIDEGLKKNILEEIEKEFKQKAKALKSKYETVGMSEEEKTAKKNKKSKSKSKSKDGKFPPGLMADMESLKEEKTRAKEEVSGLQLLKILSEIEYHELSLKYGEIFEAGTGAETLRKIFEDINLKKEIQNLKKAKEKARLIEGRKILRRLKFFQEMSAAGVRPEWMFLEVLPVLPPDLRPMVQLDGGRYASSDLNDLYRRVINRNNRLRYLLEINAPEVILRNEKRMLQEAVDALIDNGMRKGQTVTATTGGRRLLKSLADILKGKQGRFRQNLLGKRVDYSGRSVIVVGPELKLYECGLPKKMALELFKPFVIRKILDRELAYNVRGASKLIEKQTDEVWAILEEVVKNKLVLLNRAPTLHRLGIQAFQPLLTEGEVIRVHPLVCSAFNADFDGDQMAVHLPLSRQAQKEARELMFSHLNLLKPATGMPIILPTQDIILGCYWISKIKKGRKGEGKIFNSSQEAILAHNFGEVDLKARIKLREVKGEKNKKPKKENFTETSVGRIIFNKALPKDYRFRNELVNKKIMKEIISEVIEEYPVETVRETLDKVKELGFEYSTFSGVTWGMDDLVVPPEKPAIIKKAEKKEEEIHSHYKKGLLSRKEKRSQVIEVWQRAKSEIEKLVPDTLDKNGPVFSIVDSGARGSWSHPVQMSGMIGLVINPSGQIIELPVKNSFKEGLDVLEYFISTHGARKGTADTALRTAIAGYLTRRLVDVAHEVVVTEEYCGDENGIILFKKNADDIGQDFSQKILGRRVIEDVKSAKKVIIKRGELIDRKIAEEITKNNIEKIKIYSPLTCKSIRGVCQKCYGWDLGLNKLVSIGAAVGVVASQAIGEPGTQLTMRTFHSGGVAGGGDITFGLPRVQEILEARVPGGRAQVAELAGRVLEITADRTIKIKINPKDSEDIKKLKALENEVLGYTIPSNQAILVAEGHEVKKGQQLCEGSLDLKELFELAGYEETWRYIVGEIQKIYISQGATIHDKHFEVIARQMFSRVKIKEEGDSIFSPGEIIEKARFLEENLRLKKEKKKLASCQPLLLGISRVALTIDSFLSAASFQETSRVLIKAAIKGKEDKLRGLKENVIIGKLIPVGTGFKKKK